MTFSVRAALRTSLVYCVVATCWILFTDHLFDPIFARSPLGLDTAWWQSIKGLFFVTVTSLLLYSMLVRQFSTLSRAVDRYRESEHRWQRLLNQTPEPVLILDGTSVLYANKAAVNVLGHRNSDEITGKTLDPYFIDDETGASNGIHPLVDRRENGEARVGYIRNRTGNVRCIEVHSSTILFYGKDCLLSVWRDVTSRQQYENQLLAAKNEAENASRLKSTILANLSHEIRTPLTAILGFSELLYHDPDAPREEGMELIHRSGVRLKDTLESILTLAELESGQAPYDPEPVDLREVVRSTAEIFSGQARRKGLDFEVSLPDNSVEALADPTAVAQIVMNLVSNAVKFTDKGSITVEVSHRKDAVAIIVVDTGIGKKDDFLPRIFDEFAQESQGLARAYEGSGLGLTIVRQLVDLHSGTINVDSRDGEGTTCTIELPAAS